MQRFSLKLVLRDRSILSVSDDLPAAEAAAPASLIPLWLLSFAFIHPLLPLDRLQTRQLCLLNLIEYMATLVVY